METKKVLGWWFLYNLVGDLAGAGIGFIGGFIGGFIAAILGLPEGFQASIMITVVLGAIVANFFIFKWSVRKIIES